MTELGNLDLVNDFEMIKQGAEAKIYIGKKETNNGLIVKERFKKSYRHPDLDKTLTKHRIKIEERLLKKALSLGISVPQVFKSDFNRGFLVMEFVKNSQTVKDYLFDLAKKGGEKEEELKSKVAREVGRIIGILHKNKVIHGDLTTSNFLILNNTEPMVIYFIDFGLSFDSSSLEDKAVDLYVLERALLSTHSEDAEIIFEQILKAYAEAYGNDYNNVHERLEQVRQRGRKRTMVGWILFEIQLSFIKIKLIQISNVSFFDLNYSINWIKK